jgi:membrane-bound lytic murein transglycosylase B
MVHKHHFERAQLKAWLSEATISKPILTAIAKPRETLPWYKYEAIFLTKDRINEGVTFWHQHSRTLARAQEKYGVPPEMIIAIIGVETFYGKRTGDHKVLDALVTLGFDYPPRSKFFLSELEEFLVLCREEKWDPAQIKGSYAGAMGNPQFISSSYRRFAVDFNGNGNRDLMSNLDDSIGSVANYFKVNGWQKDGTIVLAAKAQGDKFKPLIASKANPTPSHSLAQLVPFGVEAKESKAKETEQFALISLEGKAGSEYWLGGQNFYVITRYNRSDHYAMAVYNLSQKIKDAYQTKLSLYRR